MGISSSLSLVSTYHFPLKDHSTLGKWRGRKCSYYMYSCISRASQVALVVKNPPANARDIRDTALITGSGRSPGEGHSNPFQYSCLENPTDRGAWQATIHRTTKSQTWLKRLSMHTQSGLRRDTKSTMHKIKKKSRNWTLSKLKTFVLWEALVINERQTTNWG